MSVKEKVNFLIELHVKDSDGKNKKLSKEQEIEIIWEGYKGKMVKEDGELVRFEQDGKTYNFFVKISSISKGWFQDSLINYGIVEIPGTPYEVYHGIDGKEAGYKIVSLQERKEGKILVTFTAIFLLVGIISLFVWWWKKR